MQITKKSLFLDANQGETKHGKAFGFIGTNLMDNYQGWFFDWPSACPAIKTVEERNRVINSLNADETCPCEPQIPYRFARLKLQKYLRQNFDLRSKS